MRVLVIGGGRVGTEIVERLEERGENVVIIDQREQTADDLHNQGFRLRDGDGTNIETLREAGAERSKIVVAATGDDDANLLVAQLASSKFDTETVLSRVNEPGNVDAFK